MRAKRDSWDNEVGEMKMSKVAREGILLLSLFLIAAMVQFYAESLPMALCFYFLPTLYSAYFFGRGTRRSPPTPAFSWWFCWAF